MKFKDLLLEDEIDNLKKKLSAQSVRENFGDKEIRQLKDKLKYDDLKYGTPQQREIAKKIDALSYWASNYTGNKQ